MSFKLLKTSANDPAFDVAFEIAFFIASANQESPLANDGENPLIFSISPDIRLLMSFPNF